MPGPAGFDATRMFQLADKAGELTEDMWEACGEPTTLKNARRAYKKYYEAKERHELDCVFRFGDLSGRERTAFCVLAF